MRYGHLLAIILLLVFILGLRYVLTQTSVEKVDVGQKTPVISGASKVQGSSTPSVSTSSVNAFYSEPTQSAAKVTYTDSGFSPQILTIAPKTVVIFENRSSQSFWLVSEDYPNPEYCGATLNSCAPVPSGQVWSFTFDKIGTWKYYSQTQIGHSGTIIVK